MSVCSVGQTWYEKHSIIHLCLESVHRDRRWLGSKTLLGRFPSHHLFSPCLLCHTLSLTFLASLSHFYRFVASPTGKLYTLECLKSAPPWAMLLLVSVKDYDVCNLTLPLNPVHSPLLSLPSLWFLWHCLLQSFLSIFFSFTYQHCWSRSPGRNLWPPGLLPSAAYGLPWRILGADRETTV